MKTLLGSVIEESNRDLYWTRIIFLSEDEKKRTTILAAASFEFLNDLYRTSKINRLEDRFLIEWRESIIHKWEKLGEKLFEKDVHYDVYANTEKGEANGIDFLISRLN